MRVGSSSVGITPPDHLMTRLSMGGYWGRTYSEGIAVDRRNPLMCKALYLVRNDPKGTGVDQRPLGPLYPIVGDDCDIGSFSGAAVVVSLDLVGLDREASNHLRHVVADTAGGLPDHRVSIVCSHTHTGPLTHRGFVGMGAVDAEYMTFLARQVAVATSAAMRSSRHCTARHISVDGIGLAVCRRATQPLGKDTNDSVTPIADPKPPWYEDCGRTFLGEAPEKPAPTSASAVVFATAELPCVVHVLWMYPCHPVVSGRVAILSADWPGAACSAIESTLPPGSSAVFLNGCCGDLNPQGCRGAGIDVAFETGWGVGTVIATAIAADLTSSMSSAASVPDVVAARTIVALPVRPLSTTAANKFKDDAAAVLTTASAAATTTGANDASITKFVEATAVAKLANRAALAARGTAERVVDVAARRPFELQVLRLPGVATLLLFEGEVFSAYSRILDSERLSDEPLMCVGLANGCIGYLPTSADVENGGYECMVSHVVYGWTQELGRAAEGLVLDAASTLLHRASRAGAQLTARSLDSGMPESHDTYNGMGIDSKRGEVHYVLCSTKHEVGGRHYRFNPAGLPTASLMGDLTMACGEVPCENVSQGKIHCKIVEGADGLLYFATHVGYYTLSDGTETSEPFFWCAMFPDPATIGGKMYQGGHFVVFDPEAGTHKSLCKIETPYGKEGALAFAMDTVDPGGRPERGLMFALTWPAGHFVVYSPLTNELTVHGPVSLGGESVHPRTSAFRTLCRAIAVDPSDGAAYISNADGEILRYSQGTLVTLPGLSLRKAYFGDLDPSQPGSMG